MTMKTLSYGHLPSEEEFDKAFDELIFDKGEEFYKITNCKRVGNCDFNQSELYKELLQATKECDEEGNEESGNWVSCVLYTLNFEWI